MYPVPIWAPILTKPDPTLRLDWQFATDRAFAVRRGPTPTFTRTTTATYEDSTGILRTAAINEPRIDFDPTTLACSGLLLEEARTNLCPRSEEFSDASWNKYNGAVTANAGVAPDGTSSADLIYPSSSGNITGQLFRTITGITAGNVVTISFFAKAAGKTICYLARVTNSSVPDAYFNLSTGAITNVASGMSAQIKQYPNGWWRVSLTSTASAGTQYAWIGSVDSAGAQFNTASGTNGILVWGAQVEVGAFPTSYIPTTTASVPRGADVLEITGANFSNFWNQPEGTLVLEMQKVSSVTSAVSQINYLSANDGTLSNYAVLCQRGQGTTGEVFRVEALGASQSLMAVGSVTGGNGPINAINTPFRIGGAYKANDFAAAINGSDCSTDNTGSIPTLTQLQFATVLSANHIRSLQYYGVRKTNFQLTQLTQLSTLDPSLTLNLQFALDAVYFSRRGPTPTFTNASTTRTFVGSDGLLKTAATNVPRIEFDPITLQCLGLLIEEQRTNQNSFSEDISNAAWSKFNGTVVSNTETSPDGSVTADLIYPSATGSLNGQVFRTVAGISSGNSVTVSAFVKASGKNFAYLSLIQNSFSPAAYFNLSTGAITNIAGGATASIKQYSNGWWRISVTSTAGAGPYYTVAGSTDSAGSANNTASGTSGILLWGLQTEVGAFASSYIPTTTTSLARSADVCSIMGAAFTGFYNQTEGAMVFKGDRVLGNNVAGISGFPRYISFDDGAVSNRIHLWWYAGPNNYMVTAVGVDSASISSTAVTDGSRFAMAARYKANDFAVSQNAGAVFTDTTGPVPTVDRVGIGMAGNFGGSINGHIYSIQYFNVIKTNAQLQTLSTP